MVALFVFSACSSDTPNEQEPKKQLKPFTLIGYNYCKGNNDEDGYFGVIFKCENGIEYVCYTNEDLTSRVHSYLTYNDILLKGGAHPIVPMEYYLDIVDTIGYNSIICVQNTMDDMSWVGPLGSVLEVEIIPISFEGNS